jgi:hypothetical protein
MKLKVNSNKIFGIVKTKVKDWIYMIAVALQRPMLKALGSLLEYSGGAYCRSLSPDGRYAISYSWKGLVYLICLDFTSPPSVVSFVFEPNRGLSEVEFSKDMQQITIFHKDGSASILSAVPGEGFYRRQVPIVQDCSMKVGFPLSDIVEFISQTSSAYWKHIENPTTKTPWKEPSPFSPATPAELDCDWEQWISHGERYLDIPRDTCESDG